MEEIIQMLKDNLTGDMEKDFAYLIKEATKYRNEGINIDQEVFDLFVNFHGDKAKQYLLDKATVQIKKRQELYQEVIKAETENNFTKSQELIVKLIDSFPTNRPLQENEQRFAFNSLFEHLYYEAVENNNHKKILRYEEPIANYYFHLALALFKQEDFEETITILDTALLYNPIYADAFILQAEAYYQLGQIDKFFKNLNIALKYAYTKYHISNIYYLLANYFVSINNKKTAQICAIISSNYLKTKQIQETHEKIKMLSSIGLTEISSLVFKEELEKHNIQFGPNPKIIEIALKLANSKKAQADKNLKKYFLQIVYEVSNDQAIKKQIDEIEQQINQNKK